MLPEFACNFLATLAHPPWTTALRRDLYMTVEGEEQTPFSLYVQSSPTRTGSFCQTTSLSRFSMLPPELQFRILTFCPASTLFQLMRVSSMLRTEASKLFWAHSDACFLIEARWLLDGGYPSHTYTDLAFLANVQNVQIEYRVDAEDIICPLRDGVVKVQPDQIAHFWTTFTKRCPKAKQAVVNQSWTSQTRGETTQRVPEALELLIRSCPPKIAAFAFIAEEAESLVGSSASALSAYKWQRAVYQPGAGSLWEKVKLGRDWKTVLVPAKPLSGLVGRFQECQRRGLLLMLEEDGLWPILVEALDRYHFDEGRSKSFSCLFSRVC
ncbi:hypothetical protein C7974DRAFT_403617 [Boeremia exigua]|uniref:uncharacterized protein n=1 Tax=Boeremia exigua TaxID=749465 RepID=UPI001E8E0EC0|nr:uncharacterized protein C7974DRAFT_403617 [Boeremia exigua]KAH6615284.1 hypothetical protein C7974DRAFT_403617 [Boeremia exigua]